MSTFEEYLDECRICDRCRWFSGFYSDGTYKCIRRHNRIHGPILTTQFYDICKELDCKDERLGESDIDKCGIHGKYWVKK